MDLKKQSPPPDLKTAFCKPSNDAANRKYRRRSPISGSSSSGGSPKRERSSSPIFSREDPARGSDNRHRRKDDGRELDRDSGRSQYGRSSDSYRHPDRQSSRSSHSYRRHDDYRYDKYADEEERNYHKLSSRSSRESRDGTRSDHARQESEHNRSRDYVRNVDKYSREKYGVGHRSKDKEREPLSLEDQKCRDRDLSSDRAGYGRRHTNSNFEEIMSGERDRHTKEGDGRDEKRDHRRSMGDRKSDRTLLYEESRGHRADSASRRDIGGYHLKENNKSDPKELDGKKHNKEEKIKCDDWESNEHTDRYVRKPGEHSEDKSVIVSENEESPAKKPKPFSFDKDTDYGKDVSKSFPAIADERQSSSSKQVQEIDGKATLEEARANGSEPANDLNAAKVAAMKAAELVNKNLVGVGYMSTDQKKKLLWGSKKSTTTEESGHRWDTALFSDRERQEKFNKLMSLRLPWYLWPIVGCEGRAESGAQTREPRWQQPPPSRETEGTPAGFREAIHGWTPTKRRPHCWSRSLRLTLDLLLLTQHCFMAFYCVSCTRIMFLLVLYLWHLMEYVLCYWKFHIFIFIKLKSHRTFFGS